jgi:hypothetical protein
MTQPEGVPMKNVSKLGGQRTGGAKSLGIKTPMKAIRAKCLDCTCDQVAEIRECTIKLCPLWPYRMGRRPKS